MVILAAAITYSLSWDSDSAFEINPDTGDLRLVSALSGSALDSLYVTVKASDGVHSAEQRVTIRVIHKNSHSPVFSLSQYFVEVNESTGAGQRLLQVTATDQESVSLTYDISDGDTDNTFRMDPLTGTGPLAVDIHAVQLYS